MGTELANVIGPAFVSRVQTVTTSFALVPILGIAIFGWFFFDADIFRAPTTCLASRTSVRSRAPRH